MAREYSKNDNRKTAPIKKVMLKKVVIKAKKSLVKLPKLIDPKRRINWAVIHCSATKEGYYFDKKDIKRWHTLPKPKGRGWSDIGYHYIILLDGTIQLGRPVTRTGAHVSGYNRGTIGICYIGGLDKNMKPKDTRTAAQKRSIKALLKALKKDSPNFKVRGHRDFPKVAKACPCFDAETEYKNI